MNKKLRKQLAKFVKDERTPMKKLVLVQHGVILNDESKGPNYNKVMKGKK